MYKRQAPERDLAGRLTEREAQILACLARHLTNKEIAAALSISEETVRVHVKSILNKFNVSDRTAAMRVALRRGIIHIK